MKILDLRDIDFSKLELYDDVISTEGSLYFDDSLFYKLFDRDKDINLENKEKKIILLNEGDVIPNLVIPNVLINNRDKFCGCAMPNIKNARCLYEYRNSMLFMLLLYEIAVTLKKIHNDPRNIVVGDLHFNNILIDEKKNHYFIDLDSCRISDVSHDRLPVCVMKYAFNREISNFDVTSSTDRLSMFLYVIYSVFGKNIDDVNIYEYDEKAEQLYTLKNMRKYFLEVKNNFGVIIDDIPYMSDLISINDFPGSKIKSRKNG